MLTLGTKWAEMGSIADDFTQQWMILGEVDSALKIRLIFDRRVTSVLYILDALDSYYRELAVDGLIDGVSGLQITVPSNFGHAWSTLFLVKCL
jgi:hypothetical protein